MRRFVAFATLVLSVAIAGAQTPPPPSPQETPEFRAGTAIVVLDVIARDKKGRPVRDLKAEDLQVFENGEQCEIRSFRLVESQGTIEPAGSRPVAGAVRPTPPATPEAGAPTGERTPLNLVTLVFDRMGLEDARRAEKAAREFIERGMGARTQAAVFAIGTRLHLVEGFTSDKEALRKAVACATSGAELSATPARPLVTSGDPLEAKNREAMANALRISDGLQRQIEGHWSLYPLLAVVKAEGPLAGRKTLVFFSPGVHVPRHLDDAFRNVISEANRSNVSVYTVDTRGLLAHKDMEMAAAALREAAATSMAQQMKDPGAPTTEAEMHIMDMAETSLRLDQQQPLSDLAEGTGGFLVGNANDFGKAVDRLALDIGGYYDIQYSPAVVAFDGGFRAISLKVARKGVVLQSRSGYFALPPSDQIVLPYEMPLLAALSAPTPPHDFAHRAAALHFAAGPEGTETVVLVEVPLAAADFEVDSRKKTFSQRLTTLALVKDADGRVVERFSDEYPISGPLDQLETARQANAVLRRIVPLAAGAYTLETASQEKGTGRTSIQRVSFEVPAAADGPQLSSLCLLQRADPLPPDAPPSDPFRYEASRLVPRLTARVSRAATPNVSLFARLYPRDGGEDPVLTLDFARDGKVVARSQPAMPAPDRSGRLGYVGGVSVAGFPPGAYEVRLTLAQGAETASASTRVELVP